ncbi:Flagellar protein FliS [bacterium HR19]|nr:Flagellar protein FliS [bacterium HR19]
MSSKKIIDDLVSRKIEFESEEEKSVESSDAQKADISAEIQSGGFQKVQGKGFDSFFESSLRTADPVSLLLMCYDLAKASLKKAIEGIRNKDYELKYEGVSRAMRIFDTLIAITEPNEVGKYLITSYLFITKKIVEADISKDEKLFEKIISYIEELEQAWRKIKSKT